MPTPSQPRKVTSRLLAEHEHQHREDEQVQVEEELRELRVAVHVADGVQVDQRADAGDEQRHRDRQRVDEEPDVDVQLADGHPREEVLHHRALVGVGFESRSAQTPTATTKAAPVMRVANQPAAGSPRRRPKRQDDEPDQREAGIEPDDVDHGRLVTSETAAARLRRAPPGRDRTDCRAERVGAGLSAANDGDADDAEHHRRPSVLRVRRRAATEPIAERSAVGAGPSAAEDGDADTIGGVRLRRAPPGRDRTDCRAERAGAGQAQRRTATQTRSRFIPSAS